MIHSIDGSDLNGCFHWKDLNVVSKIPDNYEKRYSYIRNVKYPKTTGTSNEHGYFGPLYSCVNMIIFPNNCTCLKNIVVNNIHGFDWTIYLCFVSTHFHCKHDFPGHPSVNTNGIMSHYFPKLICHCNTTVIIVVPFNNGICVVMYITMILSVI